MERKGTEKKRLPKVRLRYTGKSYRTILSTTYWCKASTWIKTAWTKLLTLCLKPSALSQIKKQIDKQQTPHGKQTLKQFVKQNAGISNIEITNDNIKAFESSAKKYGIDFALKKDTAETPPRYLVFFKGRHADALTADFKEFSVKRLTQEKKPSIRKLLSAAALSFVPMDLLVGIAGAVLIRFAVYMKGRNAKKYRKGIEYGSARWGGTGDIKPYLDPVFENNVILTQTERLMMSSRSKQPKYARNKNVLVISGSGSGKTRFFVKPNLMQMYSSYVVTDPKGTVLIECGKFLQRGGYKIKVLNTINFKKSMRYNPLAYLRSKKDILKLVNTIVANIKGDREKSGEDFWVKAEKLYYTALISYIWYEAPENEKNFTTLLEMINASEAREDDEDFQNPVDLMFGRLE